MKANFDIREKLTSALRELSATGTEAMQMPGAVITLMRNLSKGRMIIGFELTGYDELLQKLEDMVKHIALAIFACVLFTGSCTLCTTNVQPQTNGIPLVAMIGFVVSVALGIYAVMRLSRRK